MNKLYRFLLLTLFGFFCSVFAAKAQKPFDIKGIVKSMDGKLLQGASVHILNTGLYAITGADGVFSFRLPREGNYTLECSHTGYADFLSDLFFSEQNREPAMILLLPRSQVLDEVMVTAEKRELALRKLPAAITVLSAAKAEQYRIWNVQDLSSLSPNFYTTHSGDQRNVSGIRGITTTSYTPAVTTYIDGVNQFSLDTYIANLFDIERIEILRGPQGTLYGRNAMGGVINIITRQPGNSTNGYVEANFGNYGLQRHTAAVRLPMVKDKLYAGMASQISKRKGFYTNTFTNTSFDKQNAFAGDYFLKYKASPSWQFTLNFKHQNNRNSGAFPLVPDVQGAFAEPYKLQQNAVGEMVDNTSNTSLVVQHNGPAVNFSSQTAYQVNYRYYRSPLDGDFSPLDAVTIANNFGNDWNRVKVLTQEFRLTNPAGKNTRLRWTAGAYFFHQYNPVKQATVLGTQAQLIGIPDDNSITTNTSVEKVNGQALFGQVTYALSKGWFLTAGLRADREEKYLSVRGDYQKAGVGSFVIRDDTAARNRYTAVSPKIGLQYQLHPSAQAYLSFTRGYRAGGFTPMNADPSQPPLYAYKPEFSSGWEAGMKQLLFNNTLSLSFTGFYTTVSDVQVPTLVLPGAITVIRNTGKLVSKGIEMEGRAVLAKGLETDFSFGYTNARYKSLKVSSNGQVVDLGGKRQIYTPERTGLITLQYTGDLTRDHSLQFFIRGEWVYAGTTYFDLANTIRQQGYSIFNTRAGVSSRFVEIAFWTRNLGDKQYIGYAYDFGAVHLGDPRQWGITLRTKIIQ